MLDLSYHRKGYESEARAIPVDNGRPRIVIWLNHGVVLLFTPVGPV